MADRTPAPVPPAALDAAWEAFAGDGIPRPFELARIRRVVEAAAPFLVAAGRTAAAADPADLRERFAALAALEEYNGDSCDNASHNIRSVLSGDYDPRPDADRCGFDYRPAARIAENGADQ